MPLGRGSLVEESLYIFGGVMDRTRDTLHGNHNVVLDMRHGFLTAS